MTERLSPSQWRDLATFWAYWVGDAKVSKMMMDHAGHMEAESAKDGKTRVVGGGGAHSGVMAYASEGPGSADARKCRACGASDGDMCGMFGQTPRPDDCLASYKPAPAADDLVVFLRGRYQQHCTLAADRIEALTKEEARLTGIYREAVQSSQRWQERALKAEARVAELDASSGELTQAALDARFSIEQLEEDKTALQARVADLERDKQILQGRDPLAQARVARLTRLGRQMLGETYVTTDSRPNVAVGRPTVLVDYDAALAMWDALIAEANDAG
jgi:hypothetical protein